MTTDKMMRSLRFKANNISEAREWQKLARTKLFTLMMGGSEPARRPLDPRILRQTDDETGGYSLVEITLQSLPDRKVHAWMSVPKKGRERLGAVLALHGHGGTGEEIVKGVDLYWYGKRLAEMGFVVISPDIGQHELQHDTWTLMGERTWDAIRCIDYLATLSVVDNNRMAVCGLSLGGETTMYVAALDERVKAVDCAGWLTTIENMKDGHCPCWNSPGLEENFDFADIYACIAPRPLVFEIGMLEVAPGGFPVNVASRAFEEVKQAYRVFGAEGNTVLDIHENGHIFIGNEFWNPLRKAIGGEIPD